MVPHIHHPRPNSTSPRSIPFPPPTTTSTSYPMHPNKRLAPTTTALSLSSFHVTITREFKSSTTSTVSVHCNTPRLLLRPATREDASWYQTSLFTSAEVMRKYARGLPVEDDEYSNKRLEVWARRWETGDPFSGMVVLDKENQMQRIGSVVVGGGELAYLFVPQVWGKGIASEAVMALMRKIIPCLAQCGFVMPPHISATVRVDHAPSRRILSHYCLMKTDGTTSVGRYGDEEHERLTYVVDVAMLCKEWQEETTTAAASASAAAS